ncbi:MAG: hypothetical protein QOD93_2786 [Acetobacteraceae bacterium]|jgi:hypothetical protein|nr:hypothetical protein [Acetobacteraceae bacterium]
MNPVAPLFRSHRCLELGVAETILASVHVRAHHQVPEHMDARPDQTLQNTLRGGSR